MKSLSHLMFMGTHGYVTTNNTNESLVTPTNIQRLRNLPILFLSGSDNVVYKPETTDVSYTTLTVGLGQKGYEREVVQGYGHLDCWMGEDAVRDVYPRVLEHVRKCVGVAGVVGK